MILFFDTEVFKNDFLVVFFIPQTQEKVIIVNDRQQLIEFYESHKHWVWCAYNGKGYDQYIIKGILLDLNPYDISKHIISGEYGWTFSRAFNQVSLNLYEVQTTTHSLKQLEAYLGLNIKETQVSFDIDRKLTEEEMQQTIEYCCWDVESTIEVFCQRKKEWDSHISLLKAFKLPLKYISKTKAQLAAIILETDKKPHNDEFDIQPPDCIRIMKPEYQELYLWYMNKENYDYEKKQEVVVARNPTILAWGGIHGALEGFQDEGILVSCDVASLYPALMINFDFLSRNVRDKSKYVKIRDERLRLKKLKDPVQEPLKIVLNSTYGATKAKFNDMFDPRQANNVCIAGQLLLLDLIEKLEDHCKIWNINTDGLFMTVQKESDIDKLKEIAAEWEQRTGLDLEWGRHKKIVQKDVNNYILINEDGTYKSKGSYVKKLHPLDYDLAVVNRAITNYFLYGTSPEHTILNCNDLIDFQMINKITGKYRAIYHGDKQLCERCVRAFASKNETDGGLFQLHKEKESPDKIPNSPEHCYIDNSDIRGKGVDARVDKQWYIDLSKSRISDFVGGAV